MDSLTITELYHVVLVYHKSEGNPDSEGGDMKAQEHQIPFDVFCVDPFSDLYAFQVLRLYVTALKVVDVVLCEN